MPLPGSKRDQNNKQMLQEIVEPEVQVPQEPAFLQEIKEPVHEEILVEESKSTKKSKKK